MSISREMLFELIDKPHGEAAKTIRRLVDPLWGCATEPGVSWYDVKIEFAAEPACGTISMTVPAASPEEAKAFAKSRVKMQYGLYSFTVEGKLASEDLFRGPREAGPTNRRETE